MIYMLSILFAAPVCAEISDGLSLLQTHAHINLFKTLPDPKRQSPVTSGEISAKTDDANQFSCANGKGKWVKTTSIPEGNVRDLSEKTCDIKGMTLASPSERDLYENGFKVDPQLRPYTYTDQGPVKDEADCFARARIDMWCNTLLDDLLPFQRIYNKHNGIGVWYKPTTTGNSFIRHDGVPYPDCACGIVRNDRDIAPLKLVAPDADGHWYCRLEKSDMKGVTEKTPKDLSAPKEKKTPEEREACKNAKAAAKTSKAAWKALRQDLKELRARVKAARADFLDKKETRSDAC